MIDFRAGAEDDDDDDDDEFFGIVKLAIELILESR